MEIILLERIEKLGGIGDVVTVKNGFARNYLLPNNKALRANEANKKLFEANRAKIESDNADRRAAAEGRAKDIDGKQVVLIRQASNTGQLYGSVSVRDILDGTPKSRSPWASTSPARRTKPKCRSRASTSSPPCSKKNRLRRLRLLSNPTAKTNSTTPRRRRTLRPQKRRPLTRTKTLNASSARTRQKASEPRRFRGLFRARAISGDRLWGGKLPPSILVIPAKAGILSGALFR